MPKLHARAQDLQSTRRWDPRARRSPDHPASARRVSPGTGTAPAPPRVGRRKSPDPATTLIPSLRPAPPPLRRGKRPRTAAGLSSCPRRPEPPQAPALTSRPWSDRTRTDTAPKCFSRSSFSAAVSSAGRCRTSSVRPRRRATPG